MKAMIYSLLVFFALFMVACSDDFIGPNTGDYNPVQLEVTIQKVEAINILDPLFDTIPAVEMWIYAQVKNVGDKEISVPSSWFRLQDNTGTKIEVILFDPTMVRPNLADHKSLETSMQFGIGPKGVRNVGIFSFVAAKRTGWSLICEEQTGLKVDLQTRINAALVGQPPASKIVQQNQAKPINIDPNVQKQLDQIDLSNIDIEDYFPMETGDNWTYKTTITDGKPHEKNLVLKFDQCIVDNELKICDFTIDRAVLDSNILPVAIGTFVLSNGEISYYHGYSYPFFQQSMIKGKEVIEVPMGQFPCIRVERKIDTPEIKEEGRIRSNFATWSTDWYAEDIGLIRRECYGHIDAFCTNYSGEMVFELTGYQLQ